MDWKLETSGDALVGRPIGKIDETTWELFQARLSEAVKAAAVSGGKLIVDFSELDYMSSRGLRVLNLAKREAGEAVTITLAAPNSRMREILEISRYHLLFRIADDVASAV